MYGAQRQEEAPERIKYFIAGVVSKFYTRGSTQQFLSF